MFVAVCFGVAVLISGALLFAGIAIGLRLSNSKIQALQTTLAEWRSMESTLHQRLREEANLSTLVSQSVAASTQALDRATLATTVLEALDLSVGALVKRMEKGGVFRNESSGAQLGAESGGAWGGDDPTSRRTRPLPGPPRVLDRRT